MLIDPVRVVGLADELVVGLVEDSEDVVGDGGEVAVHLLAGDHRSGRVVRVAQVDELRPVSDRAEDRLDVVAVVGQRNRDRDRAHPDRGQRVDGEGRPAVDDLVARVEGDEREVGDDPVGTGGHGDEARVDAVLVRERADQQIGAPVRVVVQLGQAALDRLDCLRERPEVALVGAELDDAVEAELALDLLDRLAGLVGDEAVERGPD